MTSDEKQQGPPPAATKGALLDAAVLALVCARSREGARAACLAELGITDTQVDGLLDEAAERIVLAADYDRRREVGLAYTRLTDLYQRALTDGDHRAAIAAQRELNRLLGLQYIEPPPAGAGPIAAGEDGVSGQAPGDEDHRPPAAAAELIAAIEKHLEPLGLADDPHADYADLIAAAQREIRLLRKAVGKRRAAATRKKPGRKKPTRRTRAPRMTPAGSPGTKEATDDHTAQADAAADQTQGPPAPPAPQGAPSEG